jgi:5-methylcytosine-specific restriction endonuclease McrA
MVKLSDKRRETRKRWMKQNRGRINASQRAWMKRNPEFARLWGAFARDQRRNGRCDHRIDLASWKRVRAAFGECCCYCGETGNLELEHLTPIVRGGRPVLGNLALACGECNRQKMTMTVEEFRPDRAAEIRRVARLEGDPADLDDDCPLPLTSPTSRAIWRLLTRGRTDAGRPFRPGRRAALGSRAAAKAPRRLARVRPRGWPATVPLPKAAWSARDAAARDEG